VKKKENKKKLKEMQEITPQKSHSTKPPPTCTEKLQIAFRTGS